MRSVYITYGMVLPIDRFLVFHIASKVAFVSYSSPRSLNSITLELYQISQQLVTVITEILVCRTSILHTPSTCLDPQD